MSRVAAFRSLYLFSVSCRTTSPSIEEERDEDAADDCTLQAELVEIKDWLAGRRFARLV